VVVIQAFDEPVAPANYTAATLWTFTGKELQSFLDKAVDNELPLDHVYAVCEAREELKENLQTVKSAMYPYYVCMYIVFLMRIDVIRVVLSVNYTMQRWHIIERWRIPKPSEDSKQVFISFVTDNLTDVDQIWLSSDADVQATQSVGIQEELEALVFKD